MSLFIDYPHHSASSINQFIEYRHSWFLAKFKGIRLPMGEYAHRGSAVELGISEFLKAEGDKDIEDCCEIAKTKFETLCMGIKVSDDVRSSIGPAVKAGINYFDPETHPCSDTPKMQSEFLVKIDGLDIPFKGFLDFEFSTLIEDTKVVKMTPSKNKQGYVIQGSLYRYAMNKPVNFVYLVCLKGGVKATILPITDEDYEWGMKQIVNYGKVIERIIKAPISLDVMQDFFVPNPAAMWDDKEMKLVMDYYGL